MKVTQFPRGVEEQTKPKLQYVKNVNKLLKAVWKTLKLCFLFAVGGKAH